MVSLSFIEKKLKSLGAEFCVAIETITHKANQWNCLLFDWDGVFNRGYKSVEQGSGFCEADSMGINMLRFGYWLKNQTIPFTAIITGEENPTATYFAQREHFDAICLKFSDKIQAFEALQKLYHLDYQKTFFIFDDVLDISLAQKVSGRFLVQRKSTPLFVEYAKKYEICDYITACQSGKEAVREISELILAVIGFYEKALAERIAYSDIYQEYIRQRNAIQTNILKNH